MLALLKLYKMLFSISTLGQKVFFFTMLVLIFTAAWGESHLVMAAHDFADLIAETSNNDGEFIVGNLLILGVLVFVIDILRVAINVGNAHFSAMMGGKLASRYYQRIVRFNDSPESLKISEEVSNLTTKIASIVSNAITPLLNMVNAVATIGLVFAALSRINSTATSAVTIALVVVYLTIYFVSKKTLSNNSLIIDRLIWRQTQLAQETIANWRIIKIDKVGKNLTQQFETSEDLLRKKQATNISIAVAPRYIVEALAIVVVGATVLFAAKNPHLLSVDFSIIVALAVAGQRILPIAQQAFFGMARGLGESEIIPRYCFDVENTLSSPRPVEIERSERASKPPQPFQTLAVRDIELSWRGKVQVSNLNFKICHLDHTLITGPSGSGKSTLMNALTGLLKPSSGSIYVDDKSFEQIDLNCWHDKIALVPQKVTMFDRTILENMKLVNWHAGMSQNSVENEVWRALDDVGIGELVQSLPKKLDTEIGEFGGKVSGGQLQRLSVARALLKKPAFLFLDEATVGLEADAEIELIKTIISKQTTTLVCISHSNQIKKLFKHEITL